ncbi:Coiled-coil protein [Giardia muris]|uniref:Coiled-coil protein n=1 Tax=Giardia muris TaxID=5742 RepID=A0A4Z1SUP3_GIAMU|nr:Coiled-coil protein [Giardia muris]|eukprot:TNJ29544.1 Coiled-coil protein [Giardia muris]
MDLTPEFDAKELQQLAQLESILPEDPVEQIVTLKRVILTLKQRLARENADLIEARERLCQRWADYPSAVSDGSIDALHPDRQTDRELLEEIGQELQSTIGHVTALQTSYENLEERLKQMRGRQERLKEQNTVQKRDLVELVTIRAQVETEHQRVEALEQERAELLEKNATLVSDGVELANRLNALKDEFTQKINALRTENEALIKEGEMLQKARAALETECSELRANLKKVLELPAPPPPEFQAELARKTSEAEYLKEALKAAEERNQRDTEEHKKRLQQARTDHAEELERLRKRHSDELARHTEEAKREAEVRLRDEQLAFKEELSNMRGELSRLQQQAEGYQERIRESEKLLEEERALYDELKTESTKKYTSLLSEKHQLELENAELSARASRRSSTTIPEPSISGTPIPAPEPEPDMETIEARVTYGKPEHGIPPRSTTITQPSIRSETATPREQQPTQRRESPKEKGGSIDTAKPMMKPEIAERPLTNPQLGLTLSSLLKPGERVTLFWSEALLDMALSIDDVIIRGSLSSNPSCTEIFMVVEFWHFQPIVSRAYLLDEGSLELTATGLTATCSAPFVLYLLSQCMQIQFYIIIEQGTPRSIGSIEVPLRPLTEGGALTENLVLTTSTGAELGFTFQLRITSPLEELTRMVRKFLACSALVSAL